MKAPYVAKTNKQVNICKLIPNNSEFNTPEHVKGFEFVEDLFVDNSGFGRADEAALTPEQFIKKIKAGLGYAITGVGAVSGSRRGV